MFYLGLGQPASLHEIPAAVLTSAQSESGERKGRTRLLVIYLFRKLRSAQCLLYYRTHHRSLSRFSRSRTVKVFPSISSITPTYISQEHGRATRTSGFRTPAVDLLDRPTHCLNQLPGGGTVVWGCPDRTSGSMSSLNRGWSLSEG